MWPYCGHSQLHIQLYALEWSGNRHFQLLNYVNCEEDCRLELQFTFPNSGLGCKGYKKSRLNFSLPLNGHIGHPNCVDCSVYGGIYKFNTIPSNLIMTHIYMLSIPNYKPCHIHAKMGV